MPPLTDAIPIFAYGSNMSTARLRARVPSAVAVMTGFVTGRRTVFHKRGHDGSGKADAVATRRIADRVWGVVFSIAREERPLLDACEIGYAEESVVVVGSQSQLAATMYIAESRHIDATLQPFAWYHRYVVAGAREHRLPTEYQGHLQSIATVDDPDVERNRLNASILAGGLPLERATA